MIEKLINGLLQNIVDTAQTYGIKMETQYNSDLDMITQYSKSLNLRSMFSERQLELLSKEQIEALNKESYVLMMYNYSPLRRTEGRMNNINMEIVFDPNLPESLPEFGKMKKTGEEGLSEFFKLIRDSNEKPIWTPLVDLDNNITGDSYPVDREGLVFLVSGLILPANSPIGVITNGDYVSFDVNGYIEAIVPPEFPAPVPGNCRDMMMGEIDVTCKILTSSTKIINSLQFIHVKKFQRNKPFDLSLNFGTAGIHEFEYSTEFEPIEDVGHVDYLQYGNLQQLTFTAKVTGPIFSFYTSVADFLKTIEIELKISSEPNAEPSPRPWPIP